MLLNTEPCSRIFFFFSWFDKSFKLIFFSFVLGEIVIFNIFYEIFTVCTSIVAEDSTGNPSQNSVSGFVIF